MNKTEQQIDEYLMPFSGKIQTLAQQLRTYLKTETHPTFELVADSNISVNIGYGFTEKAWDCYCAIIVYSKHINISLPSGVGIPDPEGILHGTGKRIRHIKINDFEDIKKPAVMDILMQARENAFALLKEKPTKTTGIQTIIKQISGTKKRPKQQNV